MARSVREGSPPWGRQTRPSNGVWRWGLGRAGNASGFPSAVRAHSRANHGPAHFSRVTSPTQISALCLDSVVAAFLGGANTSPSRPPFSPQHHGGFLRGNLVHARVDRALRVRLVLGRPQKARGAHVPFSDPVRAKIRRASTQARRLPTRLPAGGIAACPSIFL